MTNTIRVTEAHPRIPVATDDAPDTIDTFLWQADPHTLRFTFVSGQVGRILGADAGRWIGDRHPWRSIARADRHTAEAALRRAVRERRDAAISFTAFDASGRPFTARLAIRVSAPEGGAVRLWGLFSDTSGRRRRPAPARPALRALPLVAPPVARRAGRFAVVGLAAAFASYALAVSALRPMPSSPPAAVAIQRADRLAEVLHEHAGETAVLAEAVGSIEASVVELVSGDPGTVGTLTALEELRAKIAGLIALSPPDLAGRLRALLATIDRVTAQPSAPAQVSKPSAPPASNTAPATKPEAPTQAPSQDAPAQAPAGPAAPAAPAGVPGAPGADL